MKTEPKAKLFCATAEIAVYAVTEDEAIHEIESELAWMQGGDSHIVLAELITIEAELPEDQNVN